MTAAKAKILLVDDEEKNLRLFQHHLVNAGYEVITAKDGKEGVETAVKFQPDLILSDIIMPVCDGYQFRKEVLKHPELASIPFAFLSSKSGEEEILEGFDLDVDDYIVKTSGPRVIVAKINTLLKNIDRSKQKIVDEFAEAASSARAKVVPDGFPAFPGYEMDFWHEPFKGIPGGDFIDYFMPNQNTMAVFMGDVMGKKLGAWYFAFAYAGYIRSAIRMILQSMQLFDAGQIMQKINEAVFNDTRISEVLATLSLLILDNTSGKVSYAGAGDLPLIYKAKDAEKVRLISSKGLLLGFKKNGSYESISLDMRSGDVITLVTDGITEAEDNMQKQLGVEGLVELVETSVGTNMTKHIKESLVKYTGNNFGDDLSLVTIKKQ